MSIPVFFRPVKFKHASGQTSYIVDGGILSNFPLEVFDDASILAWPTSGFRLGEARPLPAMRHAIHGLISLLRATWSTVMEAQDVCSIAAHNFARTITIDTQGIAETDFHLTLTQRQVLYQSASPEPRTFWTTGTSRRTKRSTEVDIPGRATGIWYCQNPPHLQARP